MNFNSTEIEKALKNVTQKLGDGIDVNSLKSMGNLPSFSEFGEKAKALLPENLSKIGLDGKVTVPSLTDMKKTISNGLGDIKGVLEKEINGKIEAIRGEANAIINQGKAVYKELGNLGSHIEQNATAMTKKALDAFNSVQNMNLNAQSIGSIYNSATSTIESFTTLSPKKIKDLATKPDFLKELKTKTLDSALTKSGLTAELMAKENTINHQLDKSAYHNLFDKSISKGKLLLPKNKGDGENDFSFVTSVERAVYWGVGEGATPEASAKKSNSGSKLVNDYSLAVDNSTILIGCKVTFSDDKKMREAVDIAVPSKGINKSSNMPIVAIYFEKKDDALKYMASHPQKIVAATLKFPVSTREKAIDVKKKYVDNVKAKIAAEDKKIAELQKKLTGL